MFEKALRFIAIASLGFIVTGCATVNKMAFDKSSTAIDTKEKSVVLMTIDVSRSDGSRFVPEPFLIRLAKPNPKTKEDYQNFQLAKGADTLQENGHSVYLARLALVGGQYTVTDIAGTANAFPFTSMFAVPLNLDIAVKPGSVTYVGRVTAKLRKRAEGEFRAGPVLPLLDQAVSGMSGGTWDISVDNAAEKDIALFRNAFPVLNTVTVETTPMPAFDRAAVERLLNGGTHKPAETAKAPAAAPVSTAAGQN